MEQIIVRKKINSSTEVEMKFEGADIKDALVNATWLLGLASKCGKCGSETSLIARTASGDNTFVENVCNNHACAHKQVAGTYKKSKGLFFRDLWVPKFSAVTEESK